MLDLYINIRERRKALGLTQEELAKKVGYSGKSMIAMIEKGKVDLSQSKIVEFAEALNTAASSLMGWRDENTIAAHKNDRPANVSIEEWTREEQEEIERFKKWVKDQRGE